MKKFEHFFPGLKSSKNHAIFILEEAFNKYYEALSSDEERQKLIFEFSALIHSSKIESIPNFALPHYIEDGKMYFIDDIFAENIERQCNDILESYDEPAAQDNILNMLIAGNKEALNVDDNVNTYFDDGQYYQNENMNNPDDMDIAFDDSVKDFDIAFAEQKREPAKVVSISSEVENSGFAFSLFQQTGMDEDIEAEIEVEQKQENVSTPTQDSQKTTEYKEPEKSGKKETLIDEGEDVVILNKMNHNHIQEKIDILSEIFDDEELY